MSKSRTRIMVALLALVFSLLSAGVVTEARDGMPAVRRRHRRHHRVTVVAVPPTVTPPVITHEQPPRPPKQASIGKKFWHIVQKPFKHGDKPKLNHTDEDYGGNY